VTNLFRTEIYKLFKSKSFWIIFLICTFLGVTTPLDGHGYITQYENIGVSFYNICLLMIFPILLGGLTFGNDFVDRTVNNGVCAGHSRFKIFICKVSAYFIGVNIVLLCSPVINIIINNILHRYISYNLISDGSVLLKTFLITSLLGMAISSISIFIAFMFRDIGKTVGISTGVYLLSVMLLNTTNDIRTNFFKFLPLAQMRLILYRPIVSNQFKEATLIGIITMVLFLTISYFCFKKAELH
jgi:ABC-2 type transport system permease protein